MTCLCGFHPADRAHRPPKMGHRAPGLRAQTDHRPPRVQMPQNMAFQPTRSRAGDKAGAEGRDQGRTSGMSHHNGFYAGARRMDQVIRQAAKRVFC